MMLVVMLSLFFCLVQKLMKIGASDVTGSPLKLTTTGHDSTCSNMNCSGIQSFLLGVMFLTAGIVLQYTFWQFLTLFFTDL